MLKSLTEFGYQKLTLNNALSYRWILTPSDIVDLFAYEKKLFFWHEMASTGKRSLELRGEIQAIESGFRTRSAVMKQHNLDEVMQYLWLHENEVKRMTPNDICYLAARVSNIVREGNFMAENSLYISVATYLYLKGNDVSVLNAEDVHLDAMLKDPLLCSMDSMGRIDTQFANETLKMYHQWKTHVINDHVWQGYIAERALNRALNRRFFVSKRMEKRYRKSKMSLKKVSFAEPAATTAGTTARTKYRALPYPVTLRGHVATRVHFPDVHGFAVRKLNNGRYVVECNKGNTTAKLLPSKDFIWNDLADYEDKVTGEEFVEMESKDKFKPSLHIETVNNHKQVKSDFHYAAAKYYVPKIQDKHYRATYYDLFHPSSKTCIMNFLHFIGIYLVEEQQNAYYDFIIRAGNEGLLYRLAGLIWQIHIQQDVEELSKVLPDINVGPSRFNAAEFSEKLRSYGIDVNTTWETFQKIFSIVYPKTKTI
jgi:hypothetical protein